MEWVMGAALIAPLLWATVVEVSDFLIEFEKNARPGPSMREMKAEQKAQRREARRKAYEAPLFEQWLDLKRNGLVPKGSTFQDYLDTL